VAFPHGPALLSEAEGPIMFIILSGDKAGKLTCTTCKFKKCVGRCHFERKAA